MASAGLKPFDLERLFWGGDPWGFYGEIIFRSVVMYLVLLLLLRFLSKRALTQLSILEFGIVIVLGSAAGDPTFYQEIPLFHGVLVLVVIVLTQRIYTYVLRHSETMETVMEGKPVLMVLQGVIQKGALQDCSLSQEELFELLRGKSVTQLGEVDAAYMEQSGQLSVFKSEEVSPGLAIVPPWDLYEPTVLKAGEHAGARACLLCGMVHTSSTEQCTYCGHETLTAAVQKGNPLHQHEKG
jgi:uncharacterized membrane protein YcaP (DUF421 family)